jgi:hypothetical protein
MTTITTPSSIALVPSLKTGGMEFRSMAEHMAASRVASRAPT